MILLACLLAAVYSEPRQGARRPHIESTRLLSEVTGNATDALIPNDTVRQEVTSSEPDVGANQHEENGAVREPSTKGGDSDGLEERAKRDVEKELTSKEVKGDKEDTRNESEQTKEKDGDDKRTEKESEEKQVDKGKDNDKKEKEDEKKGQDQKDENKADNEDEREKEKEKEKEDENKK